MIPEHLQRHVISFLLAKPISPTYSRTLEIKQRPYKQFRDNHHNLLFVSKRWKSIVDEHVNEHAPSEILTPQELAELKSKVFSLDTTAIHESFLKLIKVQWPQHLKEDEFDVYETDPLQAVLNHFKPEVFIKMVEDEYKRFLVIKCVEILASRKKNVDAAASMWLSPVQPCKLVERFWHAHCLHVNKYSTDCIALVGDIIDFTGPYDDTNEESSSTSTKHKLLFRFERCFLKKSFPCYCGVPNDKDGTYVPLMLRTKLFSPKLDMEEMQSHIWSRDDGDRSCPKDDGSFSAMWFDCFGNCCPNCCGNVNKFEYDYDY